MFEFVYYQAGAALVVIILSIILFTISRPLDGQDLNIAQLFFTSLTFILDIPHLLHLFDHTSILLLRAMVGFVGMILFEIQCSRMSSFHYKIAERAFYNSLERNVLVPSHRGETIRRLM